jgi:hypothetical protein
MKNTQRASETQKIRQQINFIKTEMSPKVVVRPIRSNPKPKAVSGTQWFTRTVRVAFTSGSEEFINFTAGDIAKSFNTDATFPANLAFKLLGMKCWNMTPPATTSGSLRLDLTENTLQSPTGTSGGIVDQPATDWGNSTSSPGISLDIPNQFAKVFIATDSTNIIVQARSAVAGFTKQLFVADFHCLVRY